MENVDDTLISTWQHEGTKAFYSASNLIITEVNWRGLTSFSNTDWVFSITTVQVIEHTHREGELDSQSCSGAGWISHGGTHWTREHCRERKDGRMMLRFLLRQFRETTAELNNYLVSLTLQALLHPMPAASPSFCFAVTRLST